MDLASARCTGCTNLQAVSSGCLCVWPLSAQAQGAKYSTLVFLFCIYQTGAVLFSRLSLLLILNSLHYFKSKGTRHFPNVFLCTYFEN